jgi:hypothetical protein
MERDNWDDDEFVEVAIPTELVRRVIASISETMMEWENECQINGAEFNALIGTAAVHAAVRFIDTSFGQMEGETIQ